MTNRVWRIDSRPAGYVTGSDKIGQTRMAARNTGESRLIRTILFINTTARWAGSRSIAWINGNNLNAVESAFVLNKRPQLEERPTMQSSPLGASGRNPFADMGQILNGYSASGALRLGYYFLTDTVVDISGEASFFAREILQASLRRLRSFFLQFCSQFSVAVSYVFNGLAGENLAIGINGDIGYPEIHTEKTFRINRCSIRKNAILKQKELTLSVNKIGLTFDPLKQLPPIRTDNEGHYHPARCAGDGNPISAFIGQKSIVENNSPMWLKDVKLLFVSPVSLNDLAYRSHGILCGEVKLFSNFIVAGLVNPHLGRCFKIVSNVRSKVTSLVKPLNNIEQFCGLFIGW